MIWEELCSLSTWNQPPAIVPIEYIAEIEKLTKAALMDMVWHYAGLGSDDTVEDTMAAFREGREKILRLRRSAKRHGD